MRRILILGSSEHSRSVRAHLWNYIPEELNVADYDTVILDFVPFQISGIAEALDIDRLPRFDQFARLIFSDVSEVIVLGNLGFDLGSNPYQESTWWLPLVPVFLEEKGETIELADRGYDFYFRQVRSWSMCLRGWREQPYQNEYLAAAGISKGEVVSPRMIPIAENRYRRPISFSVQFDVSDRGGHLATSGWVLWLPPPTEISDHEAIDLILKERYGVLLEQKPPAWVGKYQLPKEAPILEAIAKLENGIQQLSEKLQNAREELSIETRFKKILYETGEEVLEPVVREALRELGAQVEDPTEPGREDGRLTDPEGREATLEIKGRTGPLRIVDVRQLRQWVDDSRAREKRESKGVLIANLDRDQPPPSRGDVFPSNCVGLARNWDISLVTTTQVFRALQAHQREELDVSAFWQRMFEAHGVCDLPELE